MASETDTKRLGDPARGLMNSGEWGKVDGLCLAKLPAAPKMNNPGRPPRWKQ